MTGRSNRLGLGVAGIVLTGVGGLTGGIATCGSSYYAIIPIMTGRSNRLGLGVSVITLTGKGFLTGSIAACGSGNNAIIPKML